MLKNLLVLLAAFGFGTHLNAQVGERQAIGVVVAKERSVLSSQRPGYLTSVPIEIGDVVNAGDVLAKIDCRMDELTVETASAELELAQSNAQLQATLRKQGAVGQSAVEASQIEVKLKEIALKKQTEALSFCEIRAPFSGIIVAKEAQAYETVQAGQKVVEIANREELHVEVVIPASWMPDIIEAQYFDFKPEFMSDKIPVRFLSISPLVDPVSQTVTATGAVDVSKLPAHVAKFFHIGIVGTSHF